MTDRARRQAFVLASVCIAGVVVLLSALTRQEGVPGGEERPRQEAAARTGPTDIPAPLILGADQAHDQVEDRPQVRGRPAPAVEQDNSQGASRSRRTHEAPAAALRAARGFTHAFLRYEQGDLAPDVRRAIRSLAAPALARSLLGNPPRPTPSMDQTPARLLGLGAGDAIGGRAVQLAAELDRAGRRSSMLLTVEPRREDWLVTAIG